MKEEKEAKFEELTGLEITKIVFQKYFGENDSIKFYCNNGYAYEMCVDNTSGCHVGIGLELIDGNLLNIINTPILEAYLATNTRKIDGPLESETWAFYRIVTNEETVVMRWIGSSNGYYSEVVDFTKIKEG